MLDNNPIEPMQADLISNAALARFQTDEDFRARVLAAGATAMAVPLVRSDMMTQATVQMTAAMTLYLADQGLLTITPEMKERGEAELAAARAAAAERQDGAPRD